MTHFDLAEKLQAEQSAFTALETQVEALVSALPEWLEAQRAQKAATAALEALKAAKNNLSDLLTLQMEIDEKKAAIDLLKQDIANALYYERRADKNAPKHPSIHALTVKTKIGQIEWATLVDQLRSLSTDLMWKNKDGNSEPLFSLSKKGQEVVTGDLRSVLKGVEYQDTPSVSFKKEKGED